VLDCVTLGPGVPSGVGAGAFLRLARSARARGVKLDASACLFLRAGVGVPIGLARDDPPLLAGFRTGPVDACGSVGSALALTLTDKSAS
jgi:hypothetical protein